MPLQKQIVPVKFSGLAGHVDPKTAQAGRLELAENCFAVRQTDGGIELRKRNGFTGYGTSIDGGGSISAGKQLGVFGSELLMTDGLKLYSRADTGSEWISRGKLTDVSCTAESITGLIAQNPMAAEPLECDVAYSGGYKFVVSGRSGTGAFSSILAIDWYVIEVTTGATVASGVIDGGYPRVVAQNGVFYLFYQNLLVLTNLVVRTWDTASPGSALSAVTTVLTNLHSSVVYDVIRDEANNSRIYVAYRNSTPTFTMLQWNANMTATTSATYGTRDPSGAIGFLRHDFLDGNVYVAIGTASEVRVLTAPTSTLVVGTDTQVDASNSTSQVTGRYTTVRNVFYTVAGSGSTTSNDKIMGWSNGTSFTVMKSVSLSSKLVTIGTKNYFLALYQQVSTDAAINQNSLFLLELDSDTTGATAGFVSVAGYLIAGTAAMRRTTRKTLGGICEVSASELAAVYGNGNDIVQQASGTWVARYYAAKSFSLVFNAAGGSSLLGRPVAYNGALYFPGAAAKVYDGFAVSEAGFYLYPKKPTLTASNAAGTMALGTYQYCSVYARRRRDGRIERSAPSEVASVTLTGAEDTVSIVSNCLRVTDLASDPLTYTEAHRIEHYRTKVNGSVFHYIGFSESLTATDTRTYSDEQPDSAIAGNPTLYTHSEVDHIWPPQVLSFEVHRDRLFAASGDPEVGTWFTHESREGIGAEFSDSLRVQTTIDDGRPLAMASLDGSLAIMKRNRIYVLTGDGPNLDGSNPYSYPTPLPAEDGPLHARAWVRTPDGIMIKSAKGWRLLDRSGGLQVIPGADAYDSLTITGGVTLDDQSFAVFSTAADGLLVWDWELKQWYVWDASNGVADGIACARWQNQLVLLVADGTVRRQVAGSYTDGTSITMKVRATWLNLRNFRLYKGMITGEAMASCTLSLAYGRDYGTADSAKTIALTTSSPKAPWIHVPDTARTETVQIELSESSTTEGVRLSEIALEVGQKPVAKKYASTSYMG